MTMPNFTIITPGGCNAKCSFCTDDMNRPASKNYLQNLIKTIATLPPEYRQVSISGGEPTISPELMTILWLIKASGRFDKVVMTTNGTKLEQYIDQIGGLVNHINLSRHAITYEKNVPIFGTKNIPTDIAVASMVSRLNKIGIDVNLNHVYEPKDHNAINESKQKYVTRYVAYAKTLNASSVAFRFDQNLNNLEETYLERDMLDLGYATTNVGGCPSCRSHTHLVNGMPVMMKASLAEPKIVMGKEIYELIYHIDGRLCIDWDGNSEYDPITNTITERTTPSTVEKILDSQIIPVVTTDKLIESIPVRTFTLPKIDPTQVRQYSGGCGGGYGRFGCGR